MRRWTLDDEAVAYPTYEKIDRYARKDGGRILKQYPGFRNLSIQQGRRPTPPGTRRLATSDIPKAARDWPQFNFIIYHACKAGGLGANALNEVRSGVLRAASTAISVTHEMSGTPARSTPERTSFSAFSTQNAGLMQAW